MTDALWEIELDGQPVKLIDQVYGVAISPEGDRLLAIENNPLPQTLWLVDLKTGQRRNLTENLDRVVCCPVWWPARPDWVLFQSWAPNDIAPDAGYLSAARLDGQEQRVLDPKNRSYGLPALAPDGQTIAYDHSGEARLYDWDGNPRQFDPKVYGLKNIQRIASPAWSPDGKQLAWYVGGDFGQGWQVGLAIFDLKAKTGRLLHLYTNAGHGGWFDAPVWSPDGQWLAFSAEDQDQARAGLWVTSVDGQEESLITSEGQRGYSPPVWSPDGRWLVAGRTLYEAGTWQSESLNLPDDAEAVAWIGPHATIADSITQHASVRSLPLGRCGIITSAHPPWRTAMRQEVLTWQDVDKLIGELLPQISGTFDSMLMITRGGLVPGGIVAEALDIRHVLTAAVRFPEMEEKMLAWPTFLQFPEDELLRGRRVLIVDDVWGSARTINTVRGRVEAAGATPAVAVLHYKPAESLFKTKKPDYFAAVTDAFIVYPWETHHKTNDVRLVEPLLG